MQNEITYPQGLTKAEIVLYRMAYNFEMKYGAKTEQAAHEAANKKIASVRRMVQVPEVWVDITTGKQHIANY